MKKWSINYLLSLAQSYEDSVNNSGKEDPDKPFLQEIVQIPSVPQRLMQAIKALIDANPTPDQWRTWAETNSTLLNNSIDDSLYWKLNLGYIVSHIFEETGDYTYIILSLNKDCPMDIDVSEQSILKGFGNIPNLYLFKGSYKEVFNVLPPNVAHEGWLADAIVYMGIGFNNDSFNEFVIKNKEKINNIRRSFEYTPKELGGGADGLAFDIGKDRVLKIFREKTGYQAAIDAINRLHSQPLLSKTEAMIDDAGELIGYPINVRGGKLQKNIYFYIIEKMTPVKSVNNKVVDSIRFIYNMASGQFDKNALLELKALLKNPLYHEKLMFLVKEMAEKISKRLDLKHNFSFDISTIEAAFPQLRDNWITNYIEEIIMKIITDRTDLHMGNLGITSYGELRYYDPVYNNQNDFL